MKSDGIGTFSVVYSFSWVSLRIKVEKIKIASMGISKILTWNLLQNDS